MSSKQEAPHESCYSRRHYRPADRPRSGHPSGAAFRPTDTLPASTSLAWPRAPVGRCASLNGKMLRLGLDRALDTVAAVASGGRETVATLPWAALRYQHTGAIRAALMARYKPATTEVSSARRGGSGCPGLTTTAARSTSRASGRRRSPRPGAHTPRATGALPGVPGRSAPERCPRCRPPRCALRRRAPAERGRCPRFGRLHRRDGRSSRSALRRAGRTGAPTRRTGAGRRSTLGCGDCVRRTHFVGVDGGSWRSDHWKTLSFRRGLSGSSPPPRIISPLRFRLVAVQFVVEEMDRKRPVPRGTGLRNAGLVVHQRGVGATPQRRSRALSRSCVTKS